MCTKPRELLLQSFVLINSYKAQHSIIKIPLIIDPIVHDRLHPYCYISNMLLHHLLTSLDHSFNLAKNRVRLLHGFLDLSLTRLYRAKLVRGRLRALDQIRLEITYFIISLE